MKKYSLANLLISLVAVVTTIILAKLFGAMLEMPFENIILYALLGEFALSTGRSE